MAQFNRCSQDYIVEQALRSDRFAQHLLNAVRNIKGK
jgi:hypothetical protein